MKKTLIILASLIVPTCVFGQDTDAAVEAAQELAAAPEAVAPAPKFKDYWTNSLKTNINFGQTGLWNWAAGGDNTYSLAAYIDGNANYAKDAMFWNNRLQLDYGFLYASKTPILQKNMDRIYLESKWGYKIKDKLFFSANYDFKSQFTTGWSYNTPADVTGLAGKELRQAWKDARAPLSNILSPAYTNLALGIDWKPKDWFSVSFSPLTASYTIVNDPQFRQNYGMYLKKDFRAEDSRDAIHENYKAEFDAMTDAKQKGDKFYSAARFAFGAQLKVDLKAQINDNFTYTTQLVLFEDYIKDHKAHPCPRINWDNRIDWKLAKYFALTLTTNLIYDDYVMFSGDNFTSKCNKNAAYAAKHQAAGQGPLVQFKESLSFGFTYTIASKSK